MKRLLITFVVVAAALAVFAPPLVGRLAEQQAELLVQAANAEYPNLTLTQDDYQRGWFSSRARHTLIYRNPQFSLALDNAGIGGAVFPMTIALDTTLHHGPLPLGALPLPGAWLPGLALADTDADMRTVEGLAIPGALRARLGLAGGGSAHFTSEPVEGILAGGARVRWDGLNLNVDFNLPASGFDAHGEIGTLHIDDDDGAVIAGPMRIESTGSREASTILLGRHSVSLDEVTTRGIADDARVRKLNMATTLELQGDERLRYRFDLDVAEYGTAAWQGGPAHVAVQLTNLDRATYLELMRTITAAPADARFAAAIYYLAGTNDWTRSGTELTIEALDVDLPQGRLQANLKLSLPENAAGHVLDELLGELDGEARISAPRALIALLGAIDPSVGQQVSALETIGILRADGNNLVVDLTLDDGVLTANGIPVPLKFVIGGL